MISMLDLFDFNHCSINSFQYYLMCPLMHFNKKVVQVRLKKTGNKRKQEKKIKKSTKPSYTNL